MIITKQERQNNDNNNIPKFFIILLLLITVIGAVSLLFQFLEYNYKYLSPQGGVSLNLDPYSEHERSTEKSGSQNSEKQGIAIPGFAEITINADSTEAEADLFNPEDNAGLYYVTFELRLFDESENAYETLYTSGLVEPGRHIYSIELSRPLEKGVYSAVIHVQPYYINDKRPTNNADIKIKLIAE